MKSLPTFALEELLLREGIQYIAGVDEAGRGPVAGPVTAAAVILPIGLFIHDVMDSKLLSESRRETAAESIKLHALDYAVAHVSNDRIDSINILNATRLAVKRAIESLKVQPQAILIDGKFLNLRNRICISVVKGDATVFSIAAASILAKTARDTLMRSYAKQFPQYKFDRNKGYLTDEHLVAIRTHGYCPLHRKSFSINLKAD